ncbi:MAG TPA: DUF4352 domain-containing protein [Tepidiformaceae bacterium]|nr:DUF4352 domain-containing protein [Tepidiformaceae bacterium]
MARSSFERQLEDLDRLHQRGVLTDEEYAARRATLMASPEMVAQHGGSGAGRVLKWGCLSIIGVFVLLVVVAALGAALANDDEPVPSQAGQVGTNPGDVHVALAAGVSGEIAPGNVNEKRIRITVLQIQDDVQSTNQFAKPAAGKKWWGVEVRVENVGTAEVTSPWWKLRDSQDGEYDNTVVVGAGEMLNTLFNLTPGGRTQGWVYFEIPVAASPKWLRADPNIFLKNDLCFNAR